MITFIKETWLATLVFAGLCTVHAVTDLKQCGPILTVGIPVTGFALTPAIWWFLVGRGGRFRLLRGAVAGALSLALTMNLVPVLAMYMSRNQGFRDPFAGFETVLGLMIYVGVGVPLGGVLGALIAHAQRRWPRFRSTSLSPEPTEQLPDKRNEWSLSNLIQRT